MKKAADAVRTRCYLSIERGDIPHSLRDIALIFRLSSSLRNEPTLSSQLIRMSIASMGEALVHRLLCQYDLTASELKLIEENFGSGTPNEAVATALIGERALGYDFFENPTPLIASATYGSSAWRHDRWLLLKSMTELIDSTNAPPPESLDKVALAEERLTGELKPSGIWVMNMLHNFRKRNAVSSMLVSGLGGSIRKAAEAQTGERIARAAIAVELYRLEHKRLPAALSELTSFTSAETLLDPFTGKQLIYKTNSVGSAYVIYGVGKDRKDHGGPNINPDEPNPTTTTKDIVFPVTLKRRQR